MNTKKFKASRKNSRKTYVSVPISFNLKNDLPIEYEKNENDRKRIMDYKNNLIFKQPEELEERLQSLKKNSISLMKAQCLTSHQLIILRSELNLLIKGSRKDPMVKNIEIKEKELNDIKNEVKEKEKLILDLKSYNQFQEIGKFNLNKIVENNWNQGNLYEKILIIFETSKKVGSYFQCKKYVINLLNKKVYKKEFEMILMLNFIEQAFNFLSTKLRRTKKSNILRSIKLKIEKEHKIEKNEKQKQLIAEKRKLLNDKIEKSYNKIFFLPSRKLGFNNSQIKTPKKVLFQNNIKKIPILEDFLFDNSESNHEEEEK